MASIRSPAAGRSARRCSTRTDAELLARTFAALADPVRLRLLSMIAATGEIGACDVVDASGRSQPTVSHHMKVLVEAGLVTP